MPPPQTLKLADKQFQPPLAPRTYNLHSREAEERVPFTVHARGETRLCTREALAQMAADEENEAARTKWEERHGLRAPPHPAHLAPHLAALMAQAAPPPPPPPPPSSSFASKVARPAAG